MLPCLPKRRPSFNSFPQGGRHDPLCLPERRPGFDSFPQGVGMIFFVFLSVCLLLMSFLSGVGIFFNVLRSGGCFWISFLRGVANDFFIFLNLGRLWISWRKGVGMDFLVFLRAGFPLISFLRGIGRDCLVFLSGGCFNVCSQQGRRQIGAWGCWSTPKLYLSNMGSTILDTYMYSVSILLLSTLDLAPDTHVQAHVHMHSKATDHTLLLLLVL